MTTTKTTAKIEVLNAELRTTNGSRASRKLRVAGRIPCSLGADDKHDATHISIEEHAFLATRRRHSHLFEIEVSGERQMALIRELAWDTFGDQIQHIEFKRVQRDVKTDAEVELEFLGHPKGGILTHLITHVKVRCLPALIPDVIEVAVGHLEEGAAVYGRDLKAPEGVEIVIDPNARVAAAVMAKIEIVAAAPADAAATPAAGAAAATPAAPAKS